MYKYKGTNIPSRKKKRKIETKSIKIQFNLFLKLRNKSNQIKLEIDWTVVKFNFKRQTHARSLRGAADCSWPVFPVARCSRATNRKRVAY